MMQIFNKQKLAAVSKASYPIILILNKEVTIISNGKIMGSNVNKHFYYNTVRMHQSEIIFNLHIKTFTKSTKKAKSNKTTKFANRMHK